MFVQGEYRGENDRVDLLLDKVARLGHDDDIVLFAIDPRVATQIAGGRNKGNGVEDIALGERFCRGHESVPRILAFYMTFPTTGRSRCDHSLLSALFSW